jgi:exonuclease III
MQEPAPSARIRIVGWNIRAGGGTRIEAIAAQLRAWAPDVAVLSEFRGTPPSFRLADWLREQGLEHQISTAERRSPAANRLLVASRWPLRRIGLRRAPLEPGKWILARVCCDRLFTVGAMHVPNYVSGRKLPFHNAVLDVVRRWRGGPAMLIGDTNSGWIGLDEEAPVFGPREDGWMTALNRRWRDAFRHLHGEQRTYTWYSPNGRNGFRIDQAFLNRRLLPRLTDARYEWAMVEGNPRRDAISDHAALIIDLEA